MWPAESEFGREHIEYEDLELGDLLIGAKNSRLFAPIVVYKISDPLISSNNHFVITEFCWTTSSFPIMSGQSFYVEKSAVGKNLNRILRIKDVKLKTYLKSFSIANVFDPDHLRELLVELEI